MAFADYGGPRGQTFCLALGTSTGISSLLACISFLAIRDRNPLVNGVTPSYLSYVGLTLDYFSSFLLLGPAVVNFALLFIWKNSINPHFNLNYRCHLDIDVLWSVSNTLCSGKSPRWAIWLTLSSLRLALTLIIIVRSIFSIKFTVVANTALTKTGYHITSSLYHGPRQRRAIRGFRTRTSEPSTPEGPVPLSPNLPPHRDLSMVHQLSDSTLCGTARGEPSPQNQIRLAHSHSSNLSRHTSTTEPITLGRSTIPESGNEHDLNGFVDHFQLVVSQITQETDEALDLVHSEHPPSPENISVIPIRDLPPSYDEEDLDDFDDTHVGHSHTNGNNMFNLPPVPPTLGYNEFGLPYPPDQNVRVLNGYIRRMPTIESMGSGEVASSICTSSNHAGESILTYSRPPTRNTRLSWNSTDHDAQSSESPSRANSLSARAELLVGLSTIASTTSEHGELLGRTSPLARRLSTPLSYVDHALSESYSSATNGSRGTSYHTALSESFLPPGLTPDTQSHSPVAGQSDITSDSEHLLA